jgi:hypothetical protein
MNKSPLTTALLVLLLASALASVILCWSYISNERQLPAARAQATMVNNNRALVNALANEIRVYGTNNPNSGVPLPESVFGRTSKPPSTTAPKTQGK